MVGGHGAPGPVIILRISPSTPCPRNAGENNRHGHLAEMGEACSDLVFSDQLLGGGEDKVSRATSFLKREALQSRGGCCHPPGQAMEDRGTGLSSQLFWNRSPGNCPASVCHGLKVETPQKDRVLPKPFSGPLRSTQPRPWVGLRAEPVTGQIWVQVFLCSEPGKAFQSAFLVHFKRPPWSGPMSPENSSRKAEHRRGAKRREMWSDRNGCGGQRKPKEENRQCRHCSISRLKNGCVNIAPHRCRKPGSQKCTDLPKAATESLHSNPELSTSSPGRKQEEGSGPVTIGERSCLVGARGGGGRIAVSKP